MWRLWKCPTLSQDCKRTLFRAAVGTVLLCNAETWTTIRALERRIDGVYTRLQYKALDVPWQLHMTNKEQYGMISSAMDQLRQRRLSFASHCYKKIRRSACQTSGPVGGQNWQNAPWTRQPPHIRPTTAAWFLLRNYRRTSTEDEEPREVVKNIALELWMTAKSSNDDTVYIRPILEYASNIWSPHFIKYINCIENVQRHSTKRILFIRVVNNTFKKYWQYQYEYFCSIALPIPILSSFT